MRFVKSILFIFAFIRTQSYSCKHLLLHSGQENENSPVSSVSQNFCDTTNSQPHLHLNANLLPDFSTVTSLFCP